MKAVRALLAGVSFSVGFFLVTAAYFGVTAAAPRALLVSALILMGLVLLCLLISTKTGRKGLFASSLVPLGLGVLVEITLLLFRPDFQHLSIDIPASEIARGIQLFEFAVCEGDENAEDLIVWRNESIISGGAILDAFRDSDESRSHYLRVFVYPPLSEDNAISLAEYQKVRSYSPLFLRDTLFWPLYRGSLVGHSQRINCD